MRWSEELRDAEYCQDALCPMGSPYRRHPIFFFVPSSSPAIEISIANHPPSNNMASAYKSAMRSADPDDSDDSSTTVRANSSDLSDEEQKAKPTGALSDLPLELRNRVLMLTSRGVSYR
jgi:hypothetical protein